MGTIDPVQYLKKYFHLDLISEIVLNAIRRQIAITDVKEIVTVQNIKNFINSHTKQLLQKNTNVPKHVAHKLDTYIDSVEKRTQRIRLSKLRDTITYLCMKQVLKTVFIEQIKEDIQSLFLAETKKIYDASLDYVIKGIENHLKTMNVPTRRRSKTTPFHT